MMAASRASVGVESRASGGDVSAGAGGATSEKASDRFLTPDWVTDLGRVFAGLVLPERKPTAAFALDPATEPNNPTWAKRFYTRADNGLERPWSLAPHDVCWLNPPYSAGNVIQFVGKLAGEIRDQEDTHGLLLVKADSTTAWHKLARYYATDVCHLSERVWFALPDGVVLTDRHGNPKPFKPSSALFSSDLFCFSARPHLFADVFRDHGYVEVLR